MSENWNSALSVVTNTVDLGSEDASIEDSVQTFPANADRFAGLDLGLRSFDGDRLQERIDTVSCGKEQGHPIVDRLPDADAHLQHDLTYGEEVHHVPDSWPDPELDPTQLATHMASPLPSASEIEEADPETIEDSRQWADSAPLDVDQADHAATADDFDEWAAGFNDELFTLAAGLDNAVAEMPVPDGPRETLFHIPYQLSGLSAFVPLPTQSPLRKFTLPRHLRRNGKGQSSSDEDDDEPRDPRNARFERG